MDDAPKTGRQLRFFFWIVLSTWCAILLAVVAYHLNWIRQRHDLLAEEKFVHNTVGNYACGMTEEDLPPIGHSPSQFILDMLGEPRIKSVLVFFIIDGSEEQGVKPAGEFPKIERARLLFPEAEIVACWIEQWEVDSERELLGLDLRAMISE